MSEDLIDSDDLSDIDNKVNKHNAINGLFHKGAVKERKYDLHESAR